MSYTVNYLCQKNHFRQNLRAYLANEQCWRMFCVRDTATVCVRHFSVLSWRRSFNGPYTRSVLGRFLLFLLFQTKPRTLSTYLRPTGPFSYLMCLLSQSKPSLKPRFSKTEHICRCSCRPSPLRWTCLGSGLGLGLGLGLGVW